MKKTLWKVSSILFLSLLCWCGLSLEATGATTNEVGQVLVPADKPVLLGWDYLAEEPGLTFKVWDKGTNLLATLSTNQYRVLGSSTNGPVMGVLSTYVSTNVFVKGTNEITVTVVGAVAGEESDPSNKLPIKALGKPSPPSAPRKL